MWYVLKSQSAVMATFVSFLLMSPYAQTEPNHKIFVTSHVYTGNLGGIEGASTKCQARANAAGLLGTFKALLWNGKGNAKKDLVFHAPIENGYGAVIAKGKGELFSGRLTYPVQYNEYGAAITENMSAWSGSTGRGRKHSLNCRNWSSETTFDQGRIGTTDHSSSNWLSSGNVNCASLRRLYCVSQYTWLKTVHNAEIFEAIPTIIPLLAKGIDPNALITNPER